MASANEKARAGGKPDAGQGGEHRCPSSTTPHGRPAPTVRCERCCADVRPLLAWRGTHLRADCPRCGRYVKFVPQGAPWVDRAPPRPDRTRVLVYQADDPAPALLVVLEDVIRAHPVEGAQILAEEWREMRRNNMARLRGCAELVEDEDAEIA
jgi:phage FluMu protein Com